MSQEAVERLLGRLLTDDSFRATAKKSIEVVCQNGGYNLSAGEINAISYDDVVRLEMISLQLNSNIKRV